MFLYLFVRKGENMIEKTYAGESAKVEMEKPELEELMTHETEEAYWRGREVGNERIKKLFRLSLYF